MERAEFGLGSNQDRLVKKLHVAILLPKLLQNAVLDQHKFNKLKHAKEKGIHKQAEYLLKQVKKQNKEKQLLTLLEETNQAHLLSKEKGEEEKDSIIQSNTDTWVECVPIDDICDYLISKKVLSTWDAEELKHQGSHHHHNLFLMDVLYKGSVQMFINFCKILQEHCKAHLTNQRIEKFINDYDHGDSQDASDGKRSCESNGGLPHPKRTRSSSGMQKASLLATCSQRRKYDIRTTLDEIEHKKLILHDKIPGYIICKVYFVRKWKNYNGWHCYLADETMKDVRAICFDLDLQETFDNFAQEQQTIQIRGIEFRYPKPESSSLGETFNVEIKKCTSVVKYEGDSPSIPVPDRPRSNYEMCAVTGYISEAKVKVYPACNKCKKECEPDQKKNSLYHCPKCESTKRDTGVHYGVVANVEVEASKDKIVERNVVLFKEMVEALTGIDTKTFIRMDEKEQRSSLLDDQSFWFHCRIKNGSKYVVDLRKLE